MKGLQIALLVRKLRRFCWMGGFVYWWSFSGEGSASAACAAGFFLYKEVTIFKIHIWVVLRLLLTRQWCKLMLGRCQVMSGRFQESVIDTGGSTRMDAILFSKQNGTWYWSQANLLIFCRMVLCLEAFLFFRLIIKTETKRLQYHVPFCLSQLYPILLIVNLMDHCLDAILISFDYFFFKSDWYEYKLCLFINYIFNTINVTQLSS